MTGDRSGLRALAPFTVLLVVLGLADSVTASYLVLYFTTDAGLSALETGIATSVATLSGIGLTTVAGRIVDRRTTRIPLVVALVVSAAGFALLAVVAGFVPVLLVVLLTGVSAVGFPQVFALQHASSTDADSSMATGALRAGWSFAWAVGPVAAGVVVAVAGYRVLFVAGAVLLAVGAVVTAALRLGPGRRAPATAAEDATAAPPSRRRAATRLTIAAVAVFHLAMFVGSFALPLLVTRSAHADPAWVGIAFGVCAAIEVPAAFLAARLLRRRSTTVLLVGSSLLFALYFAALAAAPVVGVVVGAQVLRGVALAVMGIAGIEALRRLMAPRLAAATAAFANALAVGLLLSGIGAGAIVELAGARVTTAAAGMLALVAAGLLVAAGWSRRSRRQ
jgi:MFS transporter, SET family, sugar efflux transporter